MAAAKQLEREQAETRRRVLAAEVALLLLLRRGARATLPPARQPWRAERAQFFEAATVRIVGEGRRAAARLGIARLGAELDSVGIAMPEPFVAVAANEAAVTRAAASAVSRAAVATAEGRSAPAAVDSSLRRIAATETHAAFGEARAKASRQVATVHTLYRVWDATMDKRTCPVCAAAHGLAIPRGERFPQGTPGSVHPYCRCVEWVLPVEMIP